MKTVTTNEPERGTQVLLSSGERRELAIMARAAWMKMKVAGATDESFDDFRHRIAIQACGRRITEARRGDFNDIKANFAAIAGKTKMAINSAERSLTEGRRIAEKKLEALLTSQKRDISYSYPLFKSMCKTTYADATTNQIWKVFFALGGTNAQRAGRQRAWKARSGKGQGARDKEQVKNPF